MPAIEDQIIASLKHGGRILIAAHQNPDGDSVGSQLAIYDLCKALGAEPLIVSHDALDQRYRFLPKAELVQTFDDRQDYGKFNQAVILEGTDLTRIGDVQSLLGNETRIINIDHHSGNSHYADLNWVEENTPAVGLMVYRLFKRAGVDLSKDNLSELYLAIFTDTGRFSFSNTNAEALVIAAKLVAGGAEPKKIADALYSTYPESQVRLLGSLLSDMELHHDGRTCLMVCDRKLLDKYGMEAAEMEGLVNYSLYPAGVEIGILLRELESNSTKVSLRSQSTFDVAELARRFSGGGHSTASGCHIPQPLAEAKKTLLLLIEEGFAA